MREAICIHIGQAGVQIGNACWELLNEGARVSRGRRLAASVASGVRSD
jgi:hypothetical protein